jgi:dienelactone hydrolase
MFAQYKNVMLNFIFLALSVLPIFSYSNQIYDNSLNESVFDRISIYFNKTATNRYERLLSEVDTNTKIFVHFHGCSGIGYSDYDIKNEYLKHDAAVIFIDFLSRRGVPLGCPGGLHGKEKHSHDRSRIDTRRKEAEVLVKDLYANGYKNIYISGHSEGGRTATTWVLPVKGVIVHGMDCMVPGFWNIQRNQKTIVLLSKNDMWLKANRSMMGCRNFFNKDWVTEVVTDDSSHAAFVTDTHVNEFRKWLQ